MSKTQKISVEKAADQLGVPEQAIRETIKHLYSNWESVKFIKLSEFEIISQALQSLAESDESQDSEELQPESENVELEEFLETELTEGELSQLVETQPEELQQLKVATIQTFSDFAIDLNKITQAIAFSTALKNFDNFKQIHSATFRHHAKQYVGEFDLEYREALNDLEVVCDPKVFLAERGIPSMV